MFPFHKALAHRRFLAGPALAAAALLLAAVPATAQQGWQFFGAGGTGYPGAGSAYSSGYAPAAGYSYAAPSFYAPGYVYTAPGYYVYSAPGYYVAPYSYAAPAAAAQTAAYYGANAFGDRPAVIDLRVPAGAVVKFGAEKTTQAGTERRFISPPLRAGRDYTYDVQVQWKDGDRTVDRHRTVDVRAGEEVNVEVTGA
jgi:uncharacterized protein (TIGR03000 family)